MDDELLQRVDEWAKHLGTTRSGFARQALRAAVVRNEETEEEERQKAGYSPDPAHATGVHHCGRGPRVGRPRLERWVMRLGETRWYRYAAARRAQASPRPNEIPLPTGMSL